MFAMVDMDYTLKLATSKRTTKRHDCVTLMEIPVRCCCVRKPRLIDLHHCITRDSLVTVETEIDGPSIRERQRGASFRGSR